MTSGSDAERHATGPTRATDEARRRRIAGAALLAVLLGYAVGAYYGLGPHPSGMTLHWWQPRRFLHGSALLGLFGADESLAIAVLTAPVVLLAAGVSGLCRASLVRLVALWAALATALFLFYGLHRPGVWRFFHWRGTAVLLSFAAVTAVALLAPLLAASWLRLRWGLRAAFYLPLVFLVAALERNITGTDPALPFSVSPWPGVTMFGIEGVASAVAGALGCLALVLAAWRLRSRPAVAAAGGFAAVVAVPAAWGLLGPRGGVMPLGTALAIGALALLAAAASSGGLAKGLHTVAGRVALGAVLLALPIGIGRAWVHLDYTATRDHRAGQINEALAAYQKRNGVYPDHLSDLVKAGLLKRVPEPRIGFAFLGRPKFSYESFGGDYNLEFAAPDWVQCAYSPPWQDSPKEAGGAGESLPGSWSCPSKPPDLW